MKSMQGPVTSGMVRLSKPRGDQASMAAMTTPIPQAMVRMAGKPKVTDCVAEVKHPLWPQFL